MSDAQCKALVETINRLAKDSKAQREELDNAKLQIAYLRHQLNKVFTPTTTTWITKKDFVSLLKAQDVLKFAAGKQRSSGDDVRFFNSKLREDDIFSIHEGESTPKHGIAVWKKSERIMLFHSVYAFQEFAKYYGVRKD